MSAETVRFSSYEDGCALIREAVQKEFPDTPVRDVHINIISKTQGNIVISIDDHTANFPPTNLVVPIRLDTEIVLTEITRQAREWYDAVIKPFTDLAFESSVPSA